MQVRRRLDTSRPFCKRISMSVSTRGRNSRAWKTWNKVFFAWWNLHSLGISPQLRLSSKSVRCNRIASCTCMPGSLMPFFCSPHILKSPVSFLLLSFSPPVLLWWESGGWLRIQQSAFLHLWCCRLGAVDSQVSFRWSGWLRKAEEDGGNWGQG